MKRASLTLALAAVALSGCSNMSGLDAKSSFACKAPDGVLCESMSGVYANAKANNLPAQRVGHGTPDPASSDQQPAGVLTKPIYSGTPIRSAPVVLRVWFAPWEDSDGDLHDQSYVYLPVDTGHWIVEHNRRRIADAFRPVRAPAAPAQGVSAAAKRGDTSSALDAPAPQPKPSAQAAAEYMSGILRPNGLPGQGPGSEPPTENE